MVQGTNSKEIPDQVLDIGSPLTTPLGNPDPYVSQTNPGVGNGLDGSPDLRLEH